MELKLKWIWWNIMLEGKNADVTRVEIECAVAVGAQEQIATGVVVALEQGDLEEIDITAILGLIQSQGGLKGQDFNLYC
jgi:hypothetical protein